MNTALDLPSPLPPGLRLSRVRDHPLRACYPYGAHDIAVHLVGPALPDTGRLLGGLVPALFAADPRCRRLVAAPDEDDLIARHTFETAGFHRVTEADLPTGTVVLYTVEPLWLADLPTALDDMPH
ncbi:GNAT family N-acetyltransferase [Streptomyces griseiscabiei]|uniref:GNAT family N-acetyltransferase n=1 Tax=Streptomyces griseiscabiei TaxID=2993540 RepID=A0ABU4L2B1_9ACTN|nr:GNAT family N-acetyltransferase [Streptomyces griseiscabiei]MBZ3901594.1 GNAT family N-acetyltransferase [Streptomyces griseiscabiei]MDX2909851.1 GNAT family N-acetyltransferase [Streptomyces griseiscabiei]